MILQYRLYNSKNEIRTLGFKNSKIMVNIKKGNYNL